MPFASGIFSRLYSFVADAAAGIPAQPTRFDNELNGIATALSDCITRDGQSVPFTNLPMGGFNFSGLAQAVSTGQALTFDQIAQIGNTNAATSSLTRAQRIASTIASPLMSIITTGYTNPGDGGGATYIRATGPFTDGSSFQSANGAWWKLCPKQTINVCMFGAIGDSTSGTPGTDCTTAFDNAIAFVLANCWRSGGSLAITTSTLFVPAGGYLIKTSKNFTATNFGSSLGIILQGNGALSTIIYTKLTEAYPALDFTGASYSSIRDLSVRQVSGCQATAGIARLSCGTDPLGYNVMDRDIIVSMLTCPGIVATVDVYSLYNVTAQGTYGAALGAGTGLGIASKFQTVISNTDLTKLEMYSCFFLGGLPLYLTGNDAVTSIGCYHAITGGYSSPITVDAGVANAAMIVIDDTVGHVGLAHYKFIAVRTENQDNSGSRNVAHCFAVLATIGGVGATVYDLDIDGVLENNNSSGTNASAVRVYTSPAAALNILKIKGQSGNTVSPLLKLTGSSSNTSYDISWSTGIPLGSVASKTGSEIKLGNVFTANDFITLSSGGGGGQFLSNYNSQLVKAISDNVFSQYATSVVMADTAAVTLVNTVTAYTGGSGAQIINSFTIPSNIIKVSSGRVRRTLEIEIPIFGTGAYTYTIQLQITDGTNTVTFCPIAVTALNLSGSARFIISNSSTTVGQMACRGDVLLGTQSSAAKAYSANTIVWTADWQANIIMTSTSSSPVAFDSASIILR
jgi:hypothetical protein